MPRRSDRARALSENQACEIAGITPQNRRAWIKRGLLPNEDVRLGLSELQVVELAIVAHLHGLLGLADATVVWLDVRVRVRERFLAPRLDLIIDVARREATLGASDEEGFSAAATGRLVRVVALAEVVSATRAAFRRICAAQAASHEQSVKARGATRTRRG